MITLKEQVLEHLVPNKILGYFMWFEKSDYTLPCLKLLFWRKTLNSCLQLVCVFIYNFAYYIL